MDRLLSMRTFAEVVDQGGFAAAARSLALSPAVVTRLVADLEAHLGVRLLQRSTRRVALTDAGDAYLARLRPILSDLAEAESLAQADTREMSGTIRIAAPPTLALHLLAPIAALFQLEQPKVRLDIQVENAAEAFVEEHDLTLLVADAAFDGAVIARKLMASFGLLCAAPGYLKRFGVPRDPADLARHRCLMLKLPAAAPGAGWRLERAVPGTGPSIVDAATRAVLTTNQIEVLLRAALDGAGIGALPVHLVTPHLAQGELEHVLPGWTTGRSVIYAALPSRKFVPARTRAFLDFMLRHTRNMLDEFEARAQQSARTPGLAPAPGPVDREF